MTGGRWTVPQSWEWVRSKDVAKIVGGGTPKTNDPGNFSDSGIKWITPADLTGYSSAYISGGRRDLSEKGYSSCGASLLPKRTVLFTSRAPVGYCAIAANEISTNQGFKSLVLEGDISPEYIRHYLLASKEYAESLASGTTFLELSGKRMGDLQLPLPPLPEQRRIVRKLDRLTAHSTKARTHLTALKTLVERYKAAVLGSIFGGMRAEEQSLRALSLMVTSGSRGWAKYYSDTGPLFIRVGDTKRGSLELDLSSVQHVSPPSNAEGQRTRLQESDIVVTITADLGRVGIVPNDLGEAYINQHVALIRLKEPDYSRYIGWFLISSLGQKQLFENDRGATKSGLGLDDIRAVSIPLPPLEEQREIVRRIDAAFARIDLLAAEAERALTLVGHLDQRILERAFSGGLVSQNPEDEPAAALLARIKAARAAATARKRRSRAKA
ncbi:MAG TPA: hypothetical protein ENJ90_00220 [Devosia sp.]|nr:hypothetical protein [Devosia sp.]